MNIVVAFTLEAFLLEYESQKTKLETRTEKRIRELDLESSSRVNQVVFDKSDEGEEVKIDSGVRFKLVRGMSGIDNLLEKMFVGEIREDRIETLQTNISEKDSTADFTDSAVTN